MSARDRTREAVTRQLDAMACDAYEIGIFEAEHRSRGRMISRTGSAERVVEQLGWLKRMNARGNDIYVRPAADTPHGLILIDDLAETRGLSEVGWEPSVVTETSPGNFQAWVRIAEAVPDALRLSVSRRLARELGGDPGAVGARQYGRLAGFTNRKPKHRQANGLAPFVLLRIAESRICSGGPALLEEASRVEPAEGTTVRLPVDREVSRDRTETAEAMFERVVARSLPKCGGDLSRADYWAALVLGRRGFAQDEIERAMFAMSPNLEERKHGHAQDYVRRTVEKALAQRG